MITDRLFQAPSARRIRRIKRPSAKATRGLYGAAIIATHEIRTPAGRRRFELHATKGWRSYRAEGLPHA